MLEFLILLPLIMVGILSMTFEVSVDELFNARKGNYFNYGAYRANQDKLIEEKVIHLNLIVTESASNWGPEYTTTTLESYLKCGCSCTALKDNYIQDQVFNSLTSRFGCNKSDKAAECRKSGKYWDSANCECICSPDIPQLCPSGEFFHSQLCRCVPVDSSFQNRRQRPPV